MKHVSETMKKLTTELAMYRRKWPAESAVVGEFEKLIETRDEDLFLRRRQAGHFTGSAWLVSRDGAGVLLTHHRKLDRWLQLGGHADGDADLAAVALREAVEESGLTGLILETAIFDLDRHRIPARGREAEHWHYDVRFVVRATDQEIFIVSSESHALAWRRIEDLAHDPAADESLSRMARKWLACRSGFSRDPVYP